MAPPPPGTQTAETIPQDGHLSEAASLLTKELEGDPNFGYVALEQSRLVVLWHGTDLAKIEGFRAQRPGVEVVVRPSACVPGPVRDKMRTLLSNDPRVRVVALGLDGSHVLVTVSKDADSTELRREYETALGCAVRLETGDVAPASEASTSPAPPGL